MTSAAAEGAQHGTQPGQDNHHLHWCRTHQRCHIQGSQLCTPELGEICTQLPAGAEQGSLEVALVTSDRVCVALLRERLVLSKMFMSKLERGNQGGEKVR